MSGTILYKTNLLKLISDKKFDQMCRICISGKGHLRNIHCTRIPKMMESCACIEVSDEDGLPPKICVSCFHLITKFYSFKKKMEYTDKILRQVLNDKLKQSDILNVALNEAEINQNVDDRDGDELSEEDIPLAQRLIIRKTIESNTKQIEQNLIFPSDGPPPLVPLAPLKKLAPIDEQPVQPLPIDTPPLVPIKTSLPNIENLEYNCSTCQQKFTDVTMFKNHKLTTCQDNALQCSICKKEFKDPKKLIGHLKGHMVSKDYACKICGLQYPNPSTVQIHIRTHTGERPFRCKICNKGFMRAAGVQGHMRIHQDVKPYQCQDCGRGFKVASNLRRHKRLHTGELPYQCKTCQKSFSQWGNLQLHVRTFHTNDRPYLCNECGKSFVNSTRLNRHMWVHSGFKPYVCRVCMKSYTNYNDLKNHERCHTGKNPEEFKKHACDLCGKRFYQRCRLASHKKSHEKVYYACQFCDRQFSSDGLLRRHLASKHDVPYVNIIENEGNNDLHFMGCEQFEVAEIMLKGELEQANDEQLRLPY
ncbi:unnamed protein product [Phaedon cochleariae]|uniref:Zinc finger protein n=1 Tax=Phaedon cochleariae TaxID=80249 RepID=A0A9P0D8Q8_PHACE|nr:unnamed protein product [Phaedon cochleariae]